MTSMTTTGGQGGQVEEQLELGASKSMFLLQGTEKNDCLLSARKLFSERMGHGTRMLSEMAFTKIGPTIWMTKYSSTA